MAKYMDINAALGSLKEIYNGASFDGTGIENKEWAEAFGYVHKAPDGLYYPYSLGSKPSLCDLLFQENPFLKFIDKK